MDAELADPPSFSLPAPHPDVVRLRVGRLLLHQAHVREACERIADALFEKGERGLAVEMAHRGQVHDASKWSGLEWAALHEDVKASHPSLFFQALDLHRRGNQHHIEYWVGGARAMSRGALLELAADVCSRGAEMGSDVWEYVVESLCPRYGITPDSRPFLVIEEGLGILLTRRFS